MDDYTGPGVSQLLGLAFAAGYIPDRGLLDELETYELDYVLDNLASLIEERGDNFHEVFTKWGVYR